MWIWCERVSIVLIRTLFFRREISAKQHGLHARFGASVLLRPCLSLTVNCVGVALSGHQISSGKNPVRWWRVQHDLFELKLNLDFARMHELAIDTRHTNYIKLLELQRISMLSRPIQSFTWNDFNPSLVGNTLRAHFSLIISKYPRKLERMNQGMNVDSLMKLTGIHLKLHCAQSNSLWIFNGRETDVNGPFLDLFVFYSHVLLIFSLLIKFIKNNQCKQALTVWNNNKQTWNSIWNEIIL